jgi:hypothetical protein
MASPTGMPYGQVPAVASGYYADASCTKQLASSIGCKPKYALDNSTGLMASNIGRSRNSGWTT